MKAEIPVVQIGKNGLTETSITHIARILRQKKVVRIRFLRSFSEKHRMKEIAEELAQKTKAGRSSQVGFVITLHKEK